MNKIVYLLLLFIISLFIWSLYLEISIKKVFFRPNFVLFGFTNFFIGPFKKHNEFLWEFSYWDINPYIVLPILMLVLHFINKKIIH